MTDATADTGEASPKSSKMPLIIGLVLALAGGSGGYYATSTGLILAPESKAKEEKTEVSEHAGKFDDIAFVPMNQLTICSGAAQL